MSNIYTSRFILQEDEQSDTCLLKIPSHWCSRRYEYAWAIKFINESDICLDAACGIPHPFKFYLASVCNNVYAFDISSNIVNKDFVLSAVENFFSTEDCKLASKYIDTINFDIASLTNLPYKNNTFDKIFCISSLKCLEIEELSLCLNEFYRTLKKDGLLVLTFDVPPLNLNTLVCLVTNIGFEFIGNLDLTKHNNTLSSPLPCCNNCFRMLLHKK